MKKIILTMLVALVPYLAYSNEDDESNFYTDLIHLADDTVDLVEDFHAIPNDTIVDSEMLQNAIDYLTTLPNGGVLHIPAGTFIFSQIIVKSNVHFVIDTAAILAQAPGTPMLRFGHEKKGTKAAITVENVSIRGDGGSYTVDFRQINGRNFVNCRNVNNFMIADANILDKFTEISSITLNAAWVNVEDGPYFRPQNGVIKNINMENGHFGYGLIQAQVGYNILFKDLSGIGGVTLRCETGGVDNAPPEINLDQIYGRNISVYDGHGGILMGSHGRPNGHVDVDGVHAESTTGAVSIGAGPTNNPNDINHDNAGFASTSVVKNVHAIYGTKAQHKLKGIDAVHCNLRYLLSEEPYPWSGGDSKEIFGGPSKTVVSNKDINIEVSNVTAEGYTYLPYLIKRGRPYETVSQCPDVSVTGLSVSQSQLTLDVAQSAQLSTTIIPENATLQGVNWYSEDTSVAIVSLNGRVTAVGPGSTTILGKAVDFGWPATVAINVSGESYGSWNNINYNDFELGWGQWVSGGSNTTLSNEYAIGTNCASIVNGSSTSQITLKDPIDLTGLSHMFIEFSVVSSLKPYAELIVEFSDNGGETWTKAKSFLSDFDFDEKTKTKEMRVELSLMLDNVDFNFTNNVKIRLRSSATSDKEVLYIDNITFNGMDTKGDNTSIQSAFNTIDLEICPNPAKGFIDVNHPPTGTINVLNIQGQHISKIESGNNHQSQIDISRYKRGVYILQFQSTNGFASKKFVVAN